MATLKGFIKKRKIWEGLEERQSFSDDNFMIDIIKDGELIKSFNNKDYVDLCKEVDDFNASLGLRQIVLLTAPDGVVGSYSKFQIDYTQGETHGLDIIE